MKYYRIVPVQTNEKGTYVAAIQNEVVSAISFLLVFLLNATSDTVSIDRCNNLDFSQSACTNFRVDRVKWENKCKLLDERLLKFYSVSDEFK